MKIVSSFSGGRTSAYMTKRLIDEGHEVISVFMNTGAEHEKTLDFVNECDKRWGLNLIWLEAVQHPEERKGATHNIVSYETASRNGEPFIEMCEKYGIPNKSYNHCNRELKLNVFNSWKRENHPDLPAAIGIRVDEMDRMSVKAKENKLIYPMVSMFPTRKYEIMSYWDKQDFNLELPEHYGNCVTCWKKSDRKLKTVAMEQPERFKLFESIENSDKCKASCAENNSGYFFRGHQTTKDIIASSKESFEVFRDRMFKQESDAPNGCGETCDIFADI